MPPAAALPDDSMKVGGGRRHSWGMQRASCVAAVAALIAALAPPAAADEPARDVDVVATGSEPACVDNADVAAAISRHAGVVAVAVEASTHGAAVEVRVSGEPARLEVSVRGGGRDLSRVLADVPCASIPDVVAAFVTAALAPAPVLAPRAAAEDPGRAEDGDPRVRMLSQAVEPYASWRYRTGLVVMSGLLAANYVLVPAVFDLHGAGGPLLHVGTGVAIGSAVVGVVAPDRRGANAITDAGLVIGVGTILIAMAHDRNAGGPLDAGDDFREANAIVGAGLIAAGLWRAVDHLAGAPGSMATALPIRRQLRTAAQRAAVGEAELREHHRRFQRARVPKRYLIPPFIASAAALAYAANDGSALERDAGLWMAGTNLALLTLVLVMPDPVTKYERRLRAAGLRVTTSPVRGGGALSVGGRF